MEPQAYRLGLYEKALPDIGDWAAKLTLTAQSGFDWLELSIDESDQRLARLDLPAKKRREIVSAIHTTGVPISTMCLSGHRKYPLGSHHKKTREKGLCIMRKALELSQELGIRLIQLAGYDVYYEPPDGDTAHYFGESLVQAVEMAATYGVTLGFETMETDFLNTTRKGMRHVSALRSPYLGMYPDIGNLKNASVLYGTDVVADLREGAGHIFAAHLKETRPGIYRDMLFGTEGHTEYVRCIRELWGQGVRMFTGEFWHHGEENYRELLKNAASFLRGKIEEACTP